MRIQAESEEEVGTNLTPLIDVVFLLLVFFMLTTTFLDRERELDIDLPQASSGEAPAAPPELVVLDVFADGHVEYAGRRLELSELQSALADVARQDPETPVTIRGDRQAAHGAVVGVLDACGLAGLFHLSVGTLEASGL